MYTRLFFKKQNKKQNNAGRQLSKELSKTRARTQLIVSHDSTVKYSTAKFKPTGFVQCAREEKG